MPAFLFHVHARKRNPDQTRIRQLLDTFDKRFGSPRIRCPLCAWEPRREDQWACSCFFQWHTFDTGGVCPACDYHWRETMCFQCHEWSRHDLWYVDADAE